ncbi:MAG: hypothetical protein HC869_26115, partial [Rhodospirillales bacterium]|nr:hypothetical protein [Rhodospirillales bacterium]
MEVVYIDVSEVPRKVLGSMSHVTSFYVWFLVAALFLGAPAIIIAVNTPKDGPLWHKVLAVTLMACAWMLPFAAGYVQKQPLRSSSLRIAPYGVSLRQMLRALASLRHKLDRSTGWTRRRVVALAMLVRLAAIAIAVAAVAYGTRGGLAKNVGGPLLLGG